MWNKDWLTIVFACGLLLASPPDATLQADELPEGTVGIASRYRGDVGIEVDPQVVFVETFESRTIDELADRWESVKAAEILSFSTDVPLGSPRGQSLLITHVGGEGDGAHLYRRLGDGYDRLHYRFYVKFDQDSAPIHHFFHVGGYNPSTPWAQGGAGQRPRGGERFTTGIEPSGSAWQWDYYTYWMEMRGSPPRGQTWGNSFIHNPELAVKRGEWECLEVMLQLNDPGESNGEMALWIDGRLVSHVGPGFPRGQWIFDKFLPGRDGQGMRWDDARRDRVELNTPPGGEPFPGFRWRQQPDEKLNFLWVLCYITGADPGHVSRIWFDQIVVATDYIGPMTPVP